jgi:arginine N-succinyltransferase
LAELLPPLEPDGTSHLWEALGRHFTNMSYGEADILSKKNKEFIKSLFPDGDVYATLLPPAAQEVVGRVGAQTRGVETMLRRIGFRYANRIDPFDGGPHFTAGTDEIRLIRETRRRTVSEVVNTVGPSPAGQRVLCAVDAPGPDWFHCPITTAAPRGNSEIVVEAAAAERLGVGTGAEVIVLPLD